MDGLRASVDGIAAGSGFSGVVRVDRQGAPVLRVAHGLAHRAHRIPMTTDSRLGIASGTKGLTALAVMGLVEEGRLALSTTARSVLGAELPLIPGDVTIEHLLAHRSGIGDYVDEDSGLPVEAYLLPVPVHRLDETEAYLPVLDGHPAVFTAGERFAYCNSGFVVLARIAERAGGARFRDLVRRRVCGPAGMVDTRFLRSDELPGRAATGYVEVAGRWRTNVLHLPVRGSGDGGIYSTVDDVHRLWTALFDGRIVSLETVREMVRPRTGPGAGRPAYGLGLWLPEPAGDVELHGYDAGVSFRSRYRPATGTGYTVIGNTAGGAWPVAAALDVAVLGDDATVADQADQADWPD